MTWQLQQVLVHHQEAGYVPKTVSMNRKTFDRLMLEVYPGTGLALTGGEITIKAEVYDGVKVRFEEGLPDGEIVVGL